MNVEKIAEKMSTRLDLLNKAVKESRFERAMYIQMQIFGMVAVIDELNDPDLEKMARWAEKRTMYSFTKDWLG